MEIKIKEKLIKNKNFALVREGFFYYIELFGRKWVNNFNISKIILNYFKKKPELLNKELIILGMEPFFCYYFSLLFKDISIIDENHDLINFSKFHKDLWESKITIIGSDLFDFLKELKGNDRIIIFISKPNQNIIYYSKPFLKELKQKSILTFFVNINHLKKEFNIEYIEKRLRQLKINYKKLEKNIVVF